MTRMTINKDSKNSRACRMNIVHRHLIDEENYLRAFNAESLQSTADGLPYPSYYARDGSRVWVITATSNKR